MKRPPLHQKLQRGSRQMQSATVPLTKSVNTGSSHSIALRRALNGYLMHRRVQRRQLSLQT